MSSKKDRAEQGYMYRYVTRKIVYREGMLEAAGNRIIYSSDQDGYQFEYVLDGNDAAWSI